MSQVKHAIVLAGGKGERLRPLTDGRPKSMVEVAGIPILDYQLNALREAGVEEVVLTVSYLREVIQDHVGDGERHGVKATYSVEETPLGRGGAIKQAMQQIGADWEDAFALNGDNLWQVDFEAFIRLHRDRNAIATVLVAPLRSPYGIVDFNENDEIPGIQGEAGAAVLVERRHVRDEQRDRASATGHRRSRGRDLSLSAEGEISGVSEPRLLARHRYGQGRERGRGRGRRDLRPAVRVFDGID